jgi:hypothetical protein
MQAQNIAIDLQMIYSSVNSAMSNLVAPNCSNIAASGSRQVELGRDILLTIRYIFNQIQSGHFDQSDYQGYLEVKQFYGLFMSGCF